MTKYLLNEINVHWIAPLTVVEVTYDENVPERTYLPRRLGYNMK